jgi:hypothetical protein
VFIFPIQGILYILISLHLLIDVRISIIPLAIVIEDLYCQFQVYYVFQSYPLGNLQNSIGAINLNQGSQILSVYPLII